MNYNVGPFPGVSVFVSMILDGFCCAQVPDMKTEANSAYAVLVDEEAVGSEDTCGLGAKILSGDGALEKFLRETKSGECMVWLCEVPHAPALLCLSFFFILYLLLDRLIFTTIFSALSALHFT